MSRIVLLLVFAAAVFGQDYGGCGNNDLHETIIGDCAKVTKNERVIYSKTCINEGDHRNYTLGWGGQEEITCIKVKANGPVHIVGGGVGNTVAVIYVESTEDQELEWESAIFIKK